MSRSLAQKIRRPLPKEIAAPGLPRVSLREAPVSHMGRAVHFRSPAGSPRQSDPQARDSYAGVGPAQARVAAGSNTNDVRSSIGAPPSYGNVIRAAARGTSTGTVGSPF